MFSLPALEVIDQSKKKRTRIMMQEPLPVSDKSYSSPSKKPVGCSFADINCKKAGAGDNVHKCLHP